jgi:nucleoside-diphosphate-sugar epimerase
MVRYLMTTLVTGAAGFIGSSLCASLCRSGFDVVGLDSMTDYYDAALKWANIRSISGSFRLIQSSIQAADLETILDGVGQVFHLAGQPGVRGSWKRGFEEHLENNVRATQILLEACQEASVARVVYASSSSVYGNALTFPTSESTIPQPYSPYGVTKLAAEHLCHAYAENFGIHVVSVRYFTVYGPGQRPDMAIGRLIRAAIKEQQFQMFGDGSQIRDFTYVDDAVDATRRAMTAEVASGYVFNVGGGSAVSMLQLIELVEETTGHRIRIEWKPAQPGDAERTGADISRAKSLLGWAPCVSLDEGVEAQVEFERKGLTL